MDLLKLDPIDFAGAVERTAQILRRNEAGIIPTDSKYALACNALESAAVGELFTIKRHGRGKAIPVLVRDISWARELAYIAPEFEPALVRCWPGAVTFVFPRRPMVPPVVCGGGQTIGLRVSPHPFAQSLLREFGYPIAVVPAHPLPEAPSDDATVILAAYWGMSSQPAVVVDAGPLTTGQPSTVIDLSGREPRVLREGAVPGDKILALL